VPNWSYLIDKAIGNIKKIFSSKHEVGKQIGETAAGMALKSIVSHIIVGATTVKVSETERIYIQSDGTINHTGPGYLVAIIYDGHDGNQYKHTVDNWYVWDGQDWSVSRQRIRT
jgi:hypothetical protein